MDVGSVMDSIDEDFLEHLANEEVQEDLARDRGRSCGRVAGRAKREGSSGEAFDKATPKAESLGKHQAAPRKFPPSAFAWGRRLKTPIANCATHFSRLLESVSGPLTTSAKQKNVQAGRGAPYVCRRSPR